MKAAKFIIYTDHTAGHNREDTDIRLNATKLLDAMVEAATVLADDDNLYCSTIYQLVPGTKGKEYRPVARNYGHGGFYVAGTGSWDTNHHLVRYTSRIDRDEWIEFYELHLDWAR